VRTEKLDWVRNEIIRMRGQPFGLLEPCGQILGRIPSHRLGKAMDNFSPCDFTKLFSLPL